MASFATVDPEITAALEVRGVLLESLAAWAYADRVVIECDDGHEMVAAHLTVEAARQHIGHVERQIAAALRLAGKHLQAVSP